MRVQLWSYNYSPELTGIAPVSTTLAEGLLELGHDVTVVAAHPHYPEPVWGTRKWPYRERRNGVSVIRLPLWAGRESAGARMRQEASFLATQSLATPFLGRPDIFISASPSFPALLPAAVRARVGRIPWIAWLHDVLPDGAVATGLLEEGLVLDASRWLEGFAYRSADRIVVLSKPFVGNLIEKGVPQDKLDLIYDPATRPPREAPAIERGGDAVRLLCMGNIGETQGLAPLVRAFEASDWNAHGDGVRLVFTGTGVAAGEVKEEIRSDRVEMMGVVSDDVLEEQLACADIGVVTQQYDGTEFNLPSKIMNYMAWGLPVLVAANPGSEVARLVGESDGGWIVDSSHPEEFPAAVKRLLEDPDDRFEKARAARAYAERHFTPGGFSMRFDELMTAIAARPA